MESQCRREVIGLHRFFQVWFNGEIERSASTFERFSGVLAPGFSIISPAGKMISRKELLDRLQPAYGIHREKGTPIRIWIEEHSGRKLSDALHLATYQEWQEIGGRRQGRLSTALFRKLEGAPNGVSWLHVHETWLPGDEGDSGEG
jgi:hypothetical protein